jgi:hypothetical protein
VSDICGSHWRLRHIWLGASFARVWFPDLGGILSVCGAVDGGGCGAVDARLPPQVSLAVEAFSCGGALPLQSCIAHRLHGAHRLRPLVSDFDAQLFF